jgi:hypothetical protein
MMSNMDNVAVEDAGRTPLKSPVMVGRKKPESQLKSEVLRILLTPAQRELIAAAAAKEEMEVSTWCRGVITARARRVVGVQGKPQAEQ